MQTKINNISRLISLVNGNKRTHSFQQITLSIQIHNSTIFTKNSQKKALANQTKQKNKTQKEKINKYYTHSSIQS